MVKYAFGFPVVAMVSHIPVKSHIAGNDVRLLSVLEYGLLSEGTACEMSQALERLLIALANRRKCISIPIEVKSMYLPLLFPKDSVNRSLQPRTLGSDHIRTTRARFSMDHV